MLTLLVVHVRVPRFVLEECLFNLIRNSIRILRLMNQSITGRNAPRVIAGVVSTFPAKTDH